MCLCVIPEANVIKKTIFFG